MSLADLGRKAKHDELSKGIPQARPAPGSAPASAGAAAGATVATAARLPVFVEAAARLPLYWRRDALASAIQLLHLAPTAEEAVEAMCLSSLTADERALQQLSRRSREFVSALAELRVKAVDRALLRKLGGEQEALSSEGESSEMEFVLSGSDGEGPGPNSDFILPPGWRTEKFRRKSIHVREYVDPHGTRYRTMEAARRAVDTARVRENMSQRMRSKFSGTLGTLGSKISGALGSSVPSATMSSE